MPLLQRAPRSALHAQSRRACCRGRNRPGRADDGFGPHHIRKPSRPDWFFDRGISGGIIGDIGAHQIEQFLFFTGSKTARIVNAATGNFANPDVPEFEDYGEVSLEGDGGLGWFRVDWYSPASIKVPGDIRLFILGTDGYMEMRKYIDRVGRPGAEHLIVADKTGAHVVDTSNVPLVFASRFLDDIRNRTETAIPQQRSFEVIRLSTEAQLGARRLTMQAHVSGGPQGGS